MRPKISKKLVLGLTTVIAVVAAGVGIGAWYATGTGSSYAKAGTSSALTLSAPATTSATLYPGVTGDVRIKVTNPNPFPIRITAVEKQATTTILTSPTDAACDLSTGVTFNDKTGLTLDLAANATAEFDVTGAVSMSNASADACQGELFVINPVKLTAISNA